MTDLRTWEDELLGQGQEVSPGASYRCPRCEQPAHAFAIVLTPDEWRCTACPDKPSEPLPEGVHGEPTPPTIEDVRGVRRHFLESTDWSQLPDVPDGTRQVWSVLRQQARDVTDTHPDVGEALAFLYDLREQGSAI